MKKILVLSALFILAFSLTGQNNRTKPVKNIIVMIPDGTSIDVLSAARWYQIYNKIGGDRLHVDPYICGTVSTYCSNAPIGDSAPTTSCYMTGIPQQVKNVAIYPVADPANDLYPIDPSKAYQPLATLLEAAKTEQNKATGLVVTCDFPHATPADCSSHYYNRDKYDYLAPQMVYNNLDVVFGGGARILTDDMRSQLKRNGTTLMEKDLAGFRKYNGDKMWSLFSNEKLPYEFDRDTSIIPSLEEMTRKAISLLSKNKNGFFLMVEGSQVDGAAHANDVVGCITEFLAFDKAVGAAVEFAKKDGNTAIIILPDHGNSGFTIGNYNCKSYARKSITELFGMISTFKNTGKGIAMKLMNTPVENIRQSFKEQTGIELTDEEFKSLVKNKDNVEKDYMEVANSKNVISSTIDIINNHSYFGFTTGGHTGEEVFLAVYHPQGNIPIGMQRNFEINSYIHSIMGLQKSLESITQQIYAKHSEVFAGLQYEIKDKKGFPVLVVKKGQNVLEVPAFKSIAYLNGKMFDLGSVTVYIDKNDTFYLPKSLVNKL